MAITICLGTFYFNVICFGASCPNKVPKPLITINSSKTDTSNLPDGAEYLRSSSERIKINITSDYYECIDVNIQSGKLVAKTAKYLRHFDEKELKETLEMDSSYDSISMEYSIPNEKIKYIYSLYYQPGANNIVYVLCESGNLYINNMSALNESIDALNNFNKTKYTNVSELVKVPVSVDRDNAPDGLPFEIKGLSNGNLIKIENY